MTSQLQEFLRKSEVKQIRYWWDYQLSQAQIDFLKNSGASKSKINKIEETKMNFPTSGTRTHWISRGRKIHVDELTEPHLANIMIHLWDKAVDQLGKDEVSIVSSFLIDNCFTFNSLRFRAYNLGLVNTQGRPIYKAYEVSNSKSNKDKIIKKYSKNQSTQEYIPLLDTANEFSNQSNGLMDKVQYLVNIYRFLDRISLTDYDVKNLIRAISKRIK